MTSSTKQNQLQLLTSIASKMSSEIQKDDMEAFSSGGGLTKLTTQELLFLQRQINHQLTINLG